MSEFMASLSLGDVLLLIFNLGSFLVVNYAIGEKLLDLRSEKKELYRKYEYGSEEMDEEFDEEKYQRYQGYQDKLTLIKFKIGECLLDRLLLIILYVVLNVLYLI